MAKPPEMAYVYNLVSMRVTYIEALAECEGGQKERGVVLDADVSGSTQTHYFAKKHPERFVNWVSEAGTVDVAVGSTLAGLIPFVNIFAFLLALRAAAHP